MSLQIRTPVTFSDNSNKYDLLLIIFGTKNRYKSRKPVTAANTMSFKRWASLQACKFSVSTLLHALIKHFYYMNSLVFRLFCDLRCCIYC